MLSSSSSFSAKGSNPSLLLFHIKIRLKQVTFILTETIFRRVFFARPIDDENEHSRNDGWECFYESHFYDTKNYVCMA